jgi:hypothetical protein
MPIRPTLAPLIFAFLTIAVASGATTALAAVEQPGGVTPRLPVAATAAPPLSSFVNVTAPALVITIPNITVTAPTLSIVLKPTPRPTSGH